MINFFKKTFFIIITSSLTLIVFLAFSLFIYAAFFFEQPNVKTQVTENKIIESEEASSPSVEKIEATSSIETVEPTPSTEKVEPTKEIVEDKVIQDEIGIKDALYATIGNRAITKSDIVNEIKIILILSNKSFSEDGREAIQTFATQSITKRIIKEIEIEKYKSLTFSLRDLENELQKLANNLNVDLDTFKNTFAANKINFADVSSRIQTELLWNSLIFELYKERLVINLDEIDDQLKLIQNKKEIEEYLISEIMIKPVSKDKLKSAIKETINKIKSDGFKEVAMNLSITETAVKGGDLGWINENNIAQKLRSTITNTAVGNVSEPVLLPQGILFFKIRDKRKIKTNIDMDDLKNELANAEKTKILNMYSLSHYDALKRAIAIKYY